MKSLEQRVIELIKEQMIIDADVRLESSLLYDLDLDSLERVELLMFLEEDFDLTINDSYLSGMNTVGDIVCLVTTLSRCQKEGTQ